MEQGDFYYYQFNFHCGHKTKMDERMRTDKPIEGFLGCEEYCEKCFDIVRIKSIVIIDPNSL